MWKEARSVLIQNFFIVDKRILPIIITVLFNLVVAMIVGFLVSFFPLYYRAIHVAVNSADEYASSVISNALDQVERGMSMCSQGFEGLDSAGIQSLYVSSTPSVSKYWMLRARLAGDLTLWLTFDDGTGLYVGRQVPCDPTIDRTSNDSVVWVTEQHTNGTFHAERWFMEGINTSLIPNSRIGPINTSYQPRQTPWYQDYINSIYAHWRPPEVDTFKEFTAMRIGAQGGLNTTAKYCVYMAEVDSDAMTQLLSAINISDSGRVILVHTATGALLGANFPFDSLVNDSGVLRPRRFTEVGDAAPLMADVVRRFQDTILNCTSYCELDAGVSFDKLFIRVMYLDSQDYGLNVRVVIAMKAVDFLSGVKASRDDALRSTMPRIVGVGVALVIVMWCTLVYTAKLYFFPNLTAASTAAGGLQHPNGITPLGSAAMSTDTPHSHSTKEKSE